MTRYAMTEAGLGNVGDRATFHEMFGSSERTWCGLTRVSVMSYEALRGTAPRRRRCIRCARAKGAAEHRRKRRDFANAEVEGSRAALRIAYRIAERGV